MKKMIVVLVALIAVPAITEAQSDRVGVGDDLSREDRAAYESDADERLSALEDKIKTYRRRQSSASAEVRRELVSAVKQLDAQRRVLEREIKGLGRATGQSWRRQRDQVEDAFRAANRVLRTVGDEMEEARYGETIPETPAVEKKLEALEERLERLQQDTHAKLDEILQKLDALDRAVKARPIPTEPDTP